MCGTDFNAGLTRVGPKTALKLIREKGDLESILAEQEEKIENFAADKRVLPASDCHR